jgi:hypothetical protein
MRRWVRLIITEGDDDWVQNVQAKSWMPPDCSGHSFGSLNRMLQINLSDEHIGEEHE